MNKSQQFLDILPCRTAMNGKELERLNPKLICTKHFDNWSFVAKSAWDTQKKKDKEWWLLERKMQHGFLTAFPHPWKSGCGTGRHMHISPPLVLTWVHLSKPDNNAMGSFEYSPSNIPCVGRGAGRDGWEIRKKEWTLPPSAKEETLVSSSSYSTPCFQWMQL